MFKNKKIIASNDSLNDLVKSEIFRRGNQVNLNFIDVSKVSDMRGLFHYSDFNGDISEWDTSKVVNMSQMFQNSKFNGDISKWNTSVVYATNGMFQNSSFNRDVSAWDVSNLLFASRMFCMSSFNGSISKWNISKLEAATDMFYNSKFNGDILDWNFQKGFLFDKDFKRVLEHSREVRNVKEMYALKNALKVMKQISRNLYNIYVKKEWREII